jgi:hypothetical protein|tara:strand:- start:802 stop:987 length:186 start_codon:yes stop_codon:yes gene_type:complete
MPLRSNEYILGVSTATGMGAVIWNIYINNMLLEDSLFVGVAAFAFAAVFHTSWRKIKKRRN